MWMGFTLPYTQEYRHSEPYTGMNPAAVMQSLAHRLREVIAIVKPDFCLRIPQY